MYTLSVSKLFRKSRIKNMSNYHVSKNKGIDQWGAKREGADRVSEYFDT